MNYTLTILFTLFTLLSCQAESEGDKFTGLDYEGNKKTCSPMKDTMCTEIFTPSDDYGLKCKDAGHKAIQCGCHDWICIK